jgi:hypothetical protein
MQVATVERPGVVEGDGVEVNGQVSRVRVKTNMAKG